MGPFENAYLKGIEEATELERHRIEIERQRSESERRCKEAAQIQLGEVFALIDAERSFFSDHGWKEEGFEIGNEEIRLRKEAGSELFLIQIWVEGDGYFVGLGSDILNRDSVVPTPIDVAEKVASYVLAVRDTASPVPVREWSGESITLYRPVGAAELRLIEATGMRAFPPRLSHQPIFYPVTNEDYARQIARDWNAKLEDDGKGYVTRFKVAAEHAARYERKVVGGREHEELWVPAKDLDAFNAAILGEIEVIAEFAGGDNN